MAVYSVRWNPFHPGVFASCSADWTVKIWEHTTATPLATFEFETSVGDVAWAPFSATTFALVTNDGKLRLYDLSVDKHEPIGEDYVHIDKKKDRPIKPTHLAFNPREPILAVGDESGQAPPRPAPTLTLL
jgi:dynein intermediate chain 1